MTQLQEPVDGVREAATESTVVADAVLSIRQLVESLPSGARLPTERALAVRLAASRSTVRHALAMLEAEGRIDRHVGRGTFVATVEEPGHESASPAEIMGARLAFEPSVLTLVVTTATASDLEEMHRCVEGGARAPTHEEFESWDGAFHRSLAVATHNALILDLYGRIEKGRKDPTWGGLKRRTFTRDLQDLYTEEHRQVVAALMERDADAAQSAMRTHLLRVRDNILGLLP